MDCAPIYVWQPENKEMFRLLNQGKYRATVCRFVLSLLGVIECSRDRLFQVLKFEIVITLTGEIVSFR